MSGPSKSLLGEHAAIDTVADSLAGCSLPIVLIR